MEQIPIDRDRLWESIRTLGEIGETDDGALMRVTGSDADRRARDTLVSWFEEAGLDVSVDAVGNIRARIDGRTDAPPVVTGSHVDTVPKGGKFDGTVGVVGPLEIVRAWNDAGFVPERPLDIVVFTEEEGTRFGVGLLGSLVETGALDLDEALALEDDDGNTLGGMLEEIGYRGSGGLGLDDAAAFLEMHVEQGPILDQGPAAVGIVDTVAGITHHRVVFEGQADHAGNTPMDMRQDAYLGAAEFALDVEAAAVDHGGDAVGTVGRSVVSPNGTNVVPGRAELGVDIRDTDGDRLAKVVADAREAARVAAGDRDLDVEWETLLDVDPSPMSPEIKSVLTAAADECDAAYETMLSGAGHDAMNVAGVAPTGMLFVPSEDGISHSPDEFTAAADLHEGTTVLETALRELVRVPDPIAEPAGSSSTE